MCDIEVFYKKLLLFLIVLWQLKLSEDDFFIDVSQESKL